MRCLLDSAARVRVLCVRGGQGRTDANVKILHVTCCNNNN